MDDEPPRKKQRTTGKGKQRRHPLPRPISSPASFDYTVDVNQSLPLLRQPELWSDSASHGNSNVDPFAYFHSNTASGPDPLMTGGPERPAINRPNRAFKRERSRSPSENAMPTRAKRTLRTRKGDIGATTQTPQLVDSPPANVPDKVSGPPPQENARGATASSASEIFPFDALSRADSPPGPSHARPPAARQGLDPASIWHQTGCCPPGAGVGQFLHCGLHRMLTL